MEQQSSYQYHANLEAFMRLRKRELRRIISVTCARNVMFGRPNDIDKMSRADCIEWLLDNRVYAPVV